MIKYIQFVKEIKKGVEMMTTLNLHKRILCSFVAVLLLLTVFCGLSINARAEVLYPHISADSYEKYLEITEMAGFESHFIRYEQIKALGQFVTFVGPAYDPEFYSKLQRFYGEDLCYRVVDNNGFQLQLSIYKSHTTDYEDYIKKNTISMPVWMKDMRKLDSEKTGYVERGPLFYDYRKGKLTRIVFFLGDRILEISYNPYIDGYIPLYDYPMDGKDTIVSRLLSSNYLVALSAYYELIQDIPLQKGETKWNRMQYKVFAFAEGTVVVTAVAAPCIWLWLRHKKKRNAATMPPESPESTPSTI